MNIHTIYNDPKICAIEELIIKLHRDGYYVDGTHQYAELVKELLQERAELYQRKTVFDAELKAVLSDFNEAISKYQTEMIERGERIIESLKVATVDMGYQAVDCICYFGEIYPAIHPIQSARARWMWHILSDYTSGLYPDRCYCRCGAAIHSISGSGEMSIEERLYNFDKSFANDLMPEGADLKLCDSIYSLCTGYGADFALLDIIWVRDFLMKLSWQHTCYPYNCLDVDRIDDLPEINK